VVKRGVLYYVEDGLKPTVTITQSHRDLVRMATRNIQRATLSEEPPTQRSLRECPTCWYRRICWP